jgi:hypothetical protein
VREAANRDDTPGLRVERAGERDEVRLASLPIGWPRMGELVVAILAVVIGHELIHLAAFPRAGLRHSVAGIWPRRGAAFVQYRRPIARNRFVAVALAPLVLLSLLPLALAAAGWQARPVIQWIGDGLFYRGG